MLIYLDTLSGGEVASDSYDTKLEAKKGIMILESKVINFLQNRTKKLPKNFILSIKSFNILMTEIIINNNNNILIIRSHVLILAFFVFVFFSVVDH